MDQWALRYGQRAAFVCVGCAGPDLAEAFGSQLRLQHCHNTYCDSMNGPSWGQLGCNGFILIDRNGNVVCKQTSAFLEVNTRAFHHVETLLDALLDEKSSRPAPPAPAVEQAVDKSFDRTTGGCAGGACAVRKRPCDDALCNDDTSGTEADGSSTADVSDAASDASASEHAPASVAPVAAPASVKVAVLDAEHDECTAALRLLADRRDKASLEGLRACYSRHFAHEEQMLDDYVWPQLAAAGGGGGGGGGFSADASMRTSHLADHSRMLRDLDVLLASPELSDASGAGKLPASRVDAVLRDFEKHADRYDGSYADRLSASLAAVTAH